MSAYQPQTDPTAVAGKRIVAAIVDVGIGWGIYWILFAAMADKAPSYYTYYSGRVSPCAGRSACSNFGDYYVSGGKAALIWLIALTYFVGVFILQRGLTGKTLGTMMMGIITVSEQGRPLGIGGALIRSGAGIVDYFPCCFPIVGLITVLRAKGHRRVGDMAAKSFVVDRSLAGQPIIVPSLVVTPPTATYGQPGYPAAGQPGYPQPGYPQPGYSHPGYPQPGHPAAPGQPGQAWSPPPPVATPPPPADSGGWGAPGATPSGDTGWAAPGATPAGDTGWGAPTTPPADEQPPVVQPPPTVAPTPPPTTAPTPTSPAAAPDPTQPQWDPQRGAYIQWDPAGQRWMQYDDATQQWRAIS